MKNFRYTTILLLALLAIGCKSHKNNPPTASAEAQLPIRGILFGRQEPKVVNDIPKATAFRMSGDYADNIAVTLSSSGELIYFPDPADISANSAPVKLGNGWWLNRQGLGYGSCFTKYSFNEYANLDKVPSPSDIKGSVIPGAVVIEIRELPFSLSEAMQNIDSIRTYIKSPQFRGNVITR